MEGGWALRLRGVDEQFVGAKPAEGPCRTGNSSGLVIPSYYHLFIYIAVIVVSSSFHNNQLIKQKNKKKTDFINLAGELKAFLYSSVV